MKKPPPESSEFLINMVGVDEIYKAHSTQDFAEKAEDIDFAED